MLEAARTATVPKMVRVAFGSHRREMTVQLVIRVIFDIVPHFKTQVGVSILYRSTLGCHTGSDQVLCKMTLPLEVNYWWKALERQAWFWVDKWSWSCMRIEVHVVLLGPLRNAVDVVLQRWRLPQTGDLRYCNVINVLPVARAEGGVNSQVINHYQKEDGTQFGALGGTSMYGHPLWDGVQELNSLAATTEEAAYPTDQPSSYT